MKYNVHDYIIDAITLEGDSIILSFPEGFHVADENGQELEPQRKKLVMTVDRTNWVNAGMPTGVVHPRLLGGHGKKCPSKN